MNCPLKDKGCGGCSDIARMYGDLMREKGEAFRQLFPQALPIMGMAEPKHYRNKVLRTFANGKTSLYHGIYRKGTHQVISVKTCLLENERAGQIANTVLDVLEKAGLPAYREDYHKGILRHMQLHRAHKTGQTLVTLVTGSEELPEGEAIARKIMGRCPEVRGVIHNYNPRSSSAVLGFKSRILSGRDEIWDEMNGLRVRLNARAFYQVNTIQAEKLYAKAIEFAELTKEDVALDAYCGVGIIGMLAAAKAGRVVGIELVRDAVECARITARVNRIDNIEFIAGDANKALKDGSFKPTVVFVDPPRAGCSEEFLQSVIKASPRRVVYVSCNPNTLRRDADILKKAGYALTKAQPVDLFPFTEHTECICLLSRKDK